MVSGACCAPPPTAGGGGNLTRAAASTYNCAPGDRGAQNVKGGKHLGFEGASFYGNGR
jgi:hypothetical protein